MPPQDHFNVAGIQASLHEKNGTHFIKLKFPYNTATIAFVKQIRGRQWNPSLRSWLVPDNDANRQLFGIALTANLFTKSVLDSTQNKLLLKGYSPHTLKCYLNHLKLFLKQLPPEKSPDELSKQEIEAYLLERQKKNSYSESDINAHINAIKFYYEQVLGKERMLFYLPRPERPMQLPRVLGEHELEKLFRVVRNLKHKTILLTAFSCGLRVSEVIKLRWRDIDTERMQIFIERSKGKKDRYVSLSPVLSDVLSSYRKWVGKKDMVYIFEGQEAGKHYSARSAQTIFNRAVRDAGIDKNVTFHSLRHSYATHLLEKGVDIKYIKELLGHFDIKTTERYLHVAKDRLVHIKSPLDYLDVDI